MQRSENVFEVTLTRSQGQRQSEGDKPAVAEPPDASRPCFGRVRKKATFPAYLFQNSALSSSYTWNTMGHREQLETVWARRKTKSFFWRWGKDRQSLGRCS